jgi:hypothetical protein
MRILIQIILAGLAAVFVSGLFACSGDKSPVPVAEKAQEKSSAPEAVLAYVDQSPITAMDLQVAIDSMIDRQAIGALSPDQKRTVLQSLVASRAIARASEKESATTDLAVVDKKVQAYREQLLVKAYMARHANPQPVTQQMVRSYYEAHPEKFGARTIRTFEWIASKVALSGSQRDDLVKELNQGGRNDDWRQWARQMVRSGHNVQYRHGQVDAQLLDAELQNIIKPLRKGQVSSVSLIEGKVHLVRITDESRVPPRPLNEVSAGIRKTLLPIQLKEAVSQISAEVLENVEVTYVNDIEGKNS